ncbi:MAG: glycosyltransferase family 2 protein [Alphaproteobacteria bacterium]|nr:glycosyltransferase family 2 protein [Alphaproteobacteria bacterium]
MAVGDSSPPQGPGHSVAAKIAVVIPCFRETAHILGVLAAIGPEVARIVVVDDACPDGTGRLVRDKCPDPRVEVIIHETNQGVGGATLTGYRRALELGADAIVKMDGDGQMDAALIPKMIRPLLVGEADYAKGNRFHDIDGLSAMPAIRLVGNLALSFATKVSTGYWGLFDPTNGFTAIHAKVARGLPFDKISRSFFFESDMLFRLYLMRAVVTDIPMPARYGTEQSSLRIPDVIGEFALKHLRNAAKRIFYSYFLRDFTAASLELTAGVILLAFGLIHGATNWAQSIATGITASAGTVVLAALPTAIGGILLLAFLHFDIGNVPRQPLHPRL